MKFLQNPINFMIKYFQKNIGHHISNLLCGFLFRSHSVCQSEKWKYLEDVFIYS